MPSNLRLVEPKKHIVDDTLTRLRHLVKLAEQGVVQEVCYATINADGSCTTGFSATADSMRRLGSIRRLEHHVNKHLDEECTP